MQRLDDPGALSLEPPACVAPQEVRLCRALGYSVKAAVEQVIDPLRVEML
jgi:hypothetical protein